MKTVLILGCVAAVLAMQAGCSGASQGVIQEPKTAYVGYHVPDLPYTTTDGKHDHVKKGYLSVTIVAFVPSDASGQAQPDPALKALSKDVRFVNLPVYVVQVTEASDKASGKVALPAGRTDKSGLTVLTDPDRIAAAAYLNPKPNQVFLLDWNNQVVEIASVNDLGYLPQRAEQLGQTAYELYQPTIWGR